MRALIVEDEATSVALLRRIIEGMGHEALIARSGEEGWEAFQANRIHLLLIDWVLPGISGPDLVRMIRQKTGTRGTYILLVTAKADRASLLEAFEAGADDYLRKPFDPHEMMARLRVGERYIQAYEALSGRVADLARANQKMKKDLEAASKVQGDLLPARLPSSPSARFAWKARPCEDLAGDTLNILQIDQRHAVLYVLDVSGHGVAASLMSVTLNRLLSAAANDSLLLGDPAPGEFRGPPRPPHQVLADLNARFQMGDSESNQYFTIILALLDLRTGLLRWSSAGHPGAIHQRLGEAEILERPALPIGFVPDAEYEEHTLQLEPGDRFFLYSDGVPEAGSRRGEHYGDDRLLENIRSCADAPLDDALSSIAIDVELWSNGKPEDDISLVAAEWIGGGDA